VQHVVVDERRLITVPWLLRLQGVGKAETAGAIKQRTLLLKDTTVGADIADHVTVYADGTAVNFTGVLRRTITADLTVRVNLDGAAFATLTIPAATATDTPVETTTFTPDTAMTDGQVLSWDVVASDASKDRAGVASFTLEWTWMSGDRLHESAVPLHGDPGSTAARLPGCAPRRAARRRLGVFGPVAERQRIPAHVAAGTAVPVPHLVSHAGGCGLHQPLCHPVPLACGYQQSRACTSFRGGPSGIPRLGLHRHRGLDELLPDLPGSAAPELG